jgi:transglutaminase-like putative cysteine protease
MLFEIDHLTRYDYTSPVHLGEHLLRFLPQEGAGQRPGRCVLDINPVPSRSEQDLDSWGNRIQRVSFQGHTDHLEIRARLEVETLGEVSLPAPGEVCLPVSYGNGLAAAPYLQLLEDPARLQSFMQPLLANTVGDGMAFLAALNRAIHAFYHRGVRLEGAPRTPAETLALGEGVCRDLTLLFMAVCRQVGLAARFVSGYQQGDGTRELRYLHAWPEVYLPGHGWRGFDPTHGTPVGDDHVAVAAAPSAEAVTPVEGGYNFKGEVITSTLTTEIRITTRRRP